MDVETGLVTGRSQRDKKRSYKDFLTEEDEQGDQELDWKEQHRAKKSHKEQYTYYKTKQTHSANHTHFCNWTNDSPDMYKAPSPSFLSSSHHMSESLDEWRDREGCSETREESMPLYWMYFDNKLGQSDVSTEGHMTAVLPSIAKGPDLRPIDSAAHFQLLGESLSLIGHRLQGTKEMVSLSGSLSLLLDSLLCALAPLACLTSQLSELNSCPTHTLAKTLDNIAYVMPGL